MGQPPTVDDLMKYYARDGKELSRRTIKRYVEKFGFSIDRNTDTVVKTL